MIIALHFTTLIRGVEEDIFRPILNNLSNSNQSNCNRGTSRVDASSVARQRYDNNKQHNNSNNKQHSNTATSSSFQFKFKLFSHLSFPKNSCHVSTTVLHSSSSTSTATTSTCNCMQDHNIESFFHYLSSSICPRLTVGGGRQLARHNKS